MQINLNPVLLKDSNPNQSFILIPQIQTQILLFIDSNPKLNIVHIPQKSKSEHRSSMIWLPNPNWNLPKIQVQIEFSNYSHTSSILKFVLQYKVLLCYVEILYENIARSLIFKEKSVLFTNENRQWRCSTISHKNIVLRIFLISIFTLFSWTFAQLFDWSIIHMNINDPPVSPQHECLFSHSNVMNTT